MTTTNPFIEAPPRRVRRPNPWRVSDYRYLLLGSLGAVLGMWIQQIALGWFVLQLTGSAFDLSLVQAASALPMLLFGLLGGVAADRLDRRRTVIITRGVIALFTLLLGVIVWSGWANLPLILAITGFGGIFWAFDLPARQAMVPQLVAPEERSSAVAWLTTVMNGTRIAGPAIGGVLLGIIGAGWCIMAAASGYIFMSLLATRIRPLPPPPRHERLDMSRELLSGLAYVVKNPTILGLLLISTAGIVFWQSHVVLLPVFAKDVLNAGASGFGLLSAASGVGALAGAFGVAAFITRNRQGWILIGCSITGSVLLPIWAGLTEFGSSMVMLLFSTIFGAASQTLSASLLQREVPDGLQGRVMSVALLAWGLSPVGLLMVGAVADLVSAQFAVTVAAMCALVISLAVFVMTPGIRKL